MSPAAAALFMDIIITQFMSKRKNTYSSAHDIINQTFLTFFDRFGQVMSNKIDSNSFNSLKLTQVQKII